jgi:hypothetical protein
MRKNHAIVLILATIYTVVISGCRKKDKELRNQYKQHTRDEKNYMAFTTISL